MVRSEKEAQVAYSAELLGANGLDNRGGISEVERQAQQAFMLLQRDYRGQQAINMVSPHRHLLHQEDIDARNRESWSCVENSLLKQMATNGNMTW